MLLLKVLTGLAISQSLEISVAINELSSKKIPKCLSFLSKSRSVCVPMSEFREERRMSYRKPEAKIEWKNIVIFMIVKKAGYIDDLIEGHFQTWMNHVGEGLDMWFITDKDDDRTIEGIIPKKRNDKVNYRLHRSHAKYDGKRIRFKVIDSFKHLNRVYLKDRSKKFFYKMDTDTYIIPENLLSYTDKLNQEAQGLPVHVGKLMCVHEDVCHASGALYGMNRIGFHATNRYFATNPRLYENEQLAFSPLFKSGSTNLMLHEDFMVSYAFKQATNVPSTYQFQFNSYFYERDGIGTEESPPICYHQLKSQDQFFDHESFFYDDKGNLRSFAELTRLWEYKTLTTAQLSTNIIQS